MYIWYIIKLSLINEFSLRRYIKEELKWINNINIRKISII